MLSHGTYVLVQFLVSIFLTFLKHLYNHLVDDLSIYLVKRIIMFESGIFFSEAVIYKNLYYFSALCETFLKAYRISVILLWCPLSAWKGSWSLPLPVKVALRSCPNLWPYNVGVTKTLSDKEKNKNSNIVFNTYHAEFIKWNNPSYIFGTVYISFRDIKMKT